MKIKSWIYSTLFASSMLWGMSSCSSFVEAVDEQDPTRPVSVASDLVIRGAQISYMGMHSGDMARLAGMWTGHFTGEDRQYITLAQYQATSGDFDAAWSNIYAGVIKQLRVIKQNAQSTSNFKVLGMAQVMEAHTFAYTAALWGNVPFTQVSDYVKFPTPAFDNQKAVYDGAIKMLDEAVANLAKTGRIPADILSTGGNATKWTKAAYSLKARLLFHQGKYAEALQAANMGIADPADDLMGLHGEEPDKNMNLYYAFAYYHRYGYLSANDAFALKMINPADKAFAKNRNNAKTDESARFAYFYAKADLGYELNVYDGAFYASSSSPILTYAETQLIKAECELELGNNAKALEALNAHRAALNTQFDGTLYAPLVEADFQAGALENKDNLSVKAAIKREIVEERYVSLTGQLEPFNDMRRTKNLLGIPAVSGSKLPQRFLYPQDEINTNPNTPKNGDLFESTELFK